MYKVKTKRKRSKPLVILMLPALIFIGFLGWLMYATGGRKSTKSHQKAHIKTPSTSPREDGVSFVPVDLDEQKVISK